jgi:hypothetical protein
LPAIAEIRLRHGQIDTLMRAKNWGVADLARETGLAESTWYRLFDGKIPLTSRTEAGILAAFGPRGRRQGVRWEELFELHYLDEAAPETVEGGVLETAP